MSWQDALAKQITDECDTLFHEKLCIAEIDDLMENADYSEDREEFIDWIKDNVIEHKPGRSLLFDLLYRDFIYLRNKGLNND